MAALSYNKRNEIINAINTLKNRAISHHTQPEMTEIGVHRLLVRKKHLPTLEETYRLCGPVTTYSSIAVNVRIPTAEISSAQLYVNMATHLDRLLPRACLTEGFHGENEPELYAKVMAWIDRRYSLGVEFGRLKAVFDDLNNYLSSAQQLVFYFEGLTTLMDMSNDEGIRDQAHRLREAKLPSKLPSLAPELRTAARDATKLVARCLLFPKDAGNTSEVALSFADGALGKSDKSWSDSERFDVL